MEILNEIDWTYIKPDMQEFIADKSCFQRSATFQIIEDTFQNPFLKDVQSNKVKKNSSNKNKNSPSTKKRKNVKSKVLETLNRKVTDYIPGLIKSLSHPQQSTLTIKQHETCVKVLRAKNTYCISMSKAKCTESEIEVYNNLIPIINDEQKVFLEYVKNMWTTKGCSRHFNIPAERNEFFDTIWKQRSNIYKKYPRFYKMCSMLPLVYKNTDIPVEIELMKRIETIGEAPILGVPNMKKKYVIPSQYDEIKTDFLNKKNKQNVVTEDNCCEQYAIQHKADIVISSSGLKCLADNCQPYDKHWNLPILVKQHRNNDNSIHTIAYVDHPLLFDNVTDHQKTSWCYKYLVKSNFINNRKKSKIFRNQKEEHGESEYCNDCILFAKKCMNGENMDTSLDTRSNKCIDNSEESSDDEKLIIDCPEESTHKPQIVNTGVITRGKSNKIKEAINMQQIDPAKAKKSNCTCQFKIQEKKLDDCDVLDFIEKIKTLNKEHVNGIEKDTASGPITYNLWRLGQRKEKNKLCKDIENDVVVLVRCKDDGIEINDQNSKEKLVLTPKLEYQTEFGAQITTSTEAAKQWTMLTFRPESKLLRVRIIPHTGEILMLEKLPLQVINNEAAKYTSWKPEMALGCFFNIFSRISKLLPGQYILRHEPKHQAFAILFSNVPERCDNGLDLEEIYKNCNKFMINQTAPWTPIDPLLVTPNLAHRNTIPCMFNPALIINKKGGQNTKIKKKVVKVKKNRSKKS